MNNNIFQHNSSCVLGVTFSLTLEKAMVGDLGESLCLKKYWFCSLRKETLVSYYISIFYILVMGIMEQMVGFHLLCEVNVLVFKTVPHHSPHLLLLALLKVSTVI